MRSPAVGCLALSVLVHASIAWQLHRSAAPPRPAPAPRAGTMVLLRLAAPARPAAAPSERRVERRARRKAAPAVAVAVTPPAPAREPVDGSVFALPRLGVAWGSQNGSAFAPPASVPPPIRLPPDPALQAMREQILRAIEAQTAQWPTPADERSARCTLQGEGAPQLQCDSLAIESALQDHVAPLHGAFEAYRRTVASAGALLVAYDHGRYLVEFRYPSRDERHSDPQ